MGSLVFDYPLNLFPDRKTIKHHLLDLIAYPGCPNFQKLDRLESFADHLANHCEPSTGAPVSVQKLINKSVEYESSKTRDFPLDKQAEELHEITMSSKMNPSGENNEDDLSSGIVSDASDQALLNSDVTCEDEVNSESAKDLIEMTVIKDEEYQESVSMQVQFLEDGEDGSVLILSDIDPEQILSGENTEEIENTIPSSNVEIEEVDENTNENQSNEEIYSCNSCGISFTSVVDHIQNFHSDHEVVVEMAQDDVNTMGDMTLLQVLPNEDGEETDDADEAFAPETKRVILDNGEIVMAKQVTNTAERWRTPQILNTLHEEQCVDRDGRLYTRKVVQIERFWDSENIKVETVDVDEEGKESCYQEGEANIDEKGTVSRIYYCSRCFTQYGNLNEFETHVCKPTQGKYSCEHCNVSYNNSKSLCAHMKVHKTLKRNNDKWATVKPNPAPAGPYRCTVCDTVFPTNKSLLLHGRMHEPVRQRLVEGPVEYSPTVSSIADRFHCQLCDKWIHVGYRKIHELSHTGQAEFNCNTCNRKFHTKENLEMHMNVHTVDKVSNVKSEKVLPYECNYCNRQFARPHEKVKHERIHTGEKPHSCDICGKSFRVAYCLTLHMRTHTGARPYSCAHCGKRFKAHSVYNHHVLTHSNVRAYKCTFCPKAFKTSVQLAGHKNSHTKPFSCTECNRPFASLYAVRVHMETHKRQNNLKYNCEACGASYARAFALRDHLKAQHSVFDELYLIKEDKEAALSILQKSDDDTVIDKIDSDNECED